MSRVTTTPTATEFAALADAFGLQGRFQEGVPYGSGHINDTFAVVLNQAGRSVRYIFQRINHRIFKDVPALMDNISRVTAHAATRLRDAECDVAARGALTLVSSLDGKPYHRDPTEAWWRCYLFIEGASTHDVIQHTGQAREAARAFGDFQKLLVDLPGGRLHETIPIFHHTRARFDALLRTLETDPCKRAAEVTAEVDFVRRHESMVSRLLDLQAQGKIPERITHNDTKLNNVMIDDRTNAAVCVIDLDTVMPGLALYDFGDMVRSATNSALEDERDVGRIHSRLDIFEALVTGYLSSARPFLTPAEIEHLAFSGRLITLEIGIRFLTDYVDGDHYFKTKRPGHNLDRARNQFALVRSMEAQQAAMEEIVRRHAQA